MLHRLRIAHVAPVIYPVPPVHYGGTERVIADLVEQQRHDHNVFIIGPNDSQVPDNVELIGNYASVFARQPDVSVAPPGLPSELEARQLEDLIRHARDFDIVHLHGSAHASAVCAALGVKAVRTIHWRADEPDHIEHFDAFPGEKVIAISADQATSVPAGRLAGVVHHGMPVERYKPGTGEGGYLAFLGRMTDQKRPDRAIELAKRTQRKLQLAGPVDPGNPTYFEEKVRPFLDDDIRHIGSVDDAAKQHFLGDAAALVFPIDWPEPFGLVMIEAMACGTPVIAWRKGSTAEIVEHGVSGFLVDSMDEAEEAVRRISEIDRAEVRSRFEERFSSERMARETTAIYRNILSGT